MNKVEQTLNSIDRANESVEDAKFSVQNTMFDVNSKIVTLEQQVEPAYMENEYIQESVLAGTLIGGGILALLGGIVAAVKKFMGKSSSGDKSEETSKKASAGDQLAVVKMTGVSDDAIQKSIKELEDAINGLDLGNKEIPDTFVATEGTKIQEDLNAIYAGLEELIELQNNINAAEDENAQTKLIKSMSAKVKEILDNIEAIDSSKLKNQTAIPVPEAVASVQAAYAFKKTFSDQKKLDEIEKNITAAKSAKLKTDETGTSEDVKQSVESLKKAMAGLHIKLVKCLTNTTDAVDAIIASTQTAILAGADEVKKQQQQQQQQQNTDDYPVLAKYNITKEQVLDDMKSGASQAFTKRLPARLSGKKIEESDLDELVAAYSDIATKNNITTDQMKSVADYKNDASFMANVETGNPQPQQQPDPAGDENVIETTAIEEAHKVINSNPTVDVNLGARIINQLSAYDWVNMVLPVERILKTGRLSPLLKMCLYMMNRLTLNGYTDAAANDPDIKSKYENICNGIINKFVVPLVAHVDKLGNDTTEAHISKQEFDKFKKDFEIEKERLRQKGLNPQQHDAEIDMPNIEAIKSNIGTLARFINKQPQRVEQIISKYIAELADKNKKVSTTNVIKMAKELLSSLNNFVNAISDTTPDTTKTSITEFINKIVETYQEAQNAIVDNNLKQEISKIIADIQKLIDIVNSKQPKPEPSAVNDNDREDFKNTLKALINKKSIHQYYIDKLSTDEAKEELLNKIAEIYGDKTSDFINNSELDTTFKNGVVQACAELWGPTGADKDQQITDLCAKYFGNDRKKYDEAVNMLKTYGSVDGFLTNDLCKRSDAKTRIHDENVIQRYINLCISISKIEGIPEGSMKTAQEYFNLIQRTGSKKDLDTLKKQLADKIFTCADQDEFSYRPELKSRLMDDTTAAGLVNDICNDLGNDVDKIEALCNKNFDDFVNDIKVVCDKKWPPVNAPKQLTETDIQALLAQYNLNATNAPDLIKDAKTIAEAINSKDPAQINPLINTIVDKINSWTTIDDINRDEQNITNYANFIFDLVNTNILDDVKSQLAKVPNVTETIANKKAAIGGNPSTGNPLAQDQIDTFVDSFMADPNYDPQRNLLKQKGLTDENIKEKLKKDLAKSADEIEQDIKTAFFNTGDDAEVSFLLYTILAQVDPNRFNEVKKELENITSIYIRNDYAEYFARTYGNDKTKAYNFIQNELTKPETDFTNDLNVMKSRDQVGYRILADIASLRGMNVNGLSDDDIINQFITNHNLTRDKMRPGVSQSDVEDSIKRGLKVLNDIKNSNSKTYNGLKNLLHNVYEKADKDFTKTGEMVLNTMLKNPLFNGPIKKVVNAIGDGNVYTILKANDKIKTAFSQYSNTQGPIIEQGISDEELQEYMNTRRHVFLNEQKEIVPNGSSEMFYEAFIYEDGYIEIL